MGENMAGSRTESNSERVGGNRAGEWGKSQLTMGTGGWGQGLSLGGDHTWFQEGSDRTRLVFQDELSEGGRKGQE